MADGPTSIIDQISSAQAQKEVTANADIDSLTPSALGARRAAACIGLTWGYYGGPYRDGSNVLQRKANGTIAMSASTVNYVEFNKTTGAVTTNTTAYTSGLMPLYRVTTGATTITSWLDDRILTFATTP